MRHNRAQMEQQVIEMYRAGTGINQIKAEFDIYDPQLYTILARHGVAMRQQPSHLDEEQAAAIVTDYLDGLSLKEIMVKYEVHTPRIYTLLRRAGYVPGRIKTNTPKSGAMYDIIQRLYDEGASIADIVANTGCSTATIYRYLTNSGRELRNSKEVKGLGPERMLDILARLEAETRAEIAARDDSMAAAATELATTGG